MLNIIDMDAVADAVDAALARDPEDLNKLLARIRKALALAEGATTDEERTAANNKAANLMAKFGITAAMLAAEGQTTETVGDLLIEVGSPYCYDKVGLLYTVVLAFGGRALYKTQSTQHSELHIFGMGADLERIKLLWPALLLQLTSEMAKADKPVGVRKDIFDRSFLAGFTSEVRRRLDTAEARAKTHAQAQRRTGPAAGSSNSVELVLTDRRTQVERCVKDAYPQSRKGRARTTKLSTTGLTAGTDAGRRVDLGGKKVGTGGGGRTAVSS